LSLSVIIITHQNNLSKGKTPTLQYLFKNNFAIKFVCVIIITNRRKEMKKILLLIAINLILSPAFGIESDNRYDYINMPYWEKFNDDILVDNITKVFENNNDLKAAVLKVNEAQRLVKISFANELPHIGFDGYVGQIFKSSDEHFGDLVIPDYTQSRYLLPLTMNYEVDIWGKNHLKTKSKKKQFEMIKQDEKSAHILISSIFACDYYNLIRIDKLLEYQQELIDTHKKVTEAIKKRYEAGTATVNDVIAAEKAMTYYEEEYQNLLEKQDLLKNQMSTLLADREFSDIRRENFDNMDISFEIPKSIDVSLLDKRPDRVKSELDLERIGIDVKVAKRNLLPSFIITGNLGFNMYNISSAHKFLADIGVVPTWDLFMGGMKIQNLKLQKDRYEIAIQHYEKTILKSIQETNDALYSLKTSANVSAISEERTNSDLKELELTKLKEEAGTADKLDLLLRKEVLITSQKQAVSAEINKIIAGINLYQALGGVDYTEKG